MTDEDGTMGTTATPGGSGAAAIDEDKANGSRRGVDTPYGTGGEPGDPALPFDQKVDEHGKLHLPREAG